MITTDICIIGAGPVGLFAVFEAGLLKMRCHLIDALPQVGGQLSEVYPQKPIYDIPGFPEVKAQDLVDNLMAQIAPFNPGFTLGERVETFDRLPDGIYTVYVRGVVKGVYLDLRFFYTQSPIGNWTKLRGKTKERDEMIYRQIGDVFTAILYQ